MNTVIAYAKNADPNGKYPAIGTIITRDGAKVTHEDMFRWLPTGDPNTYRAFVWNDSSAPSDYFPGIPEFIENFDNGYAKRLATEIQIAESDPSNRSAYIMSHKDEDGNEKTIASIPLDL